MNAPTDTWLQSILQGIPAQAGAFIIASIVVGLIAVVIIACAICEHIDHKRKARTFGQQIEDNQRRERRPAHWGEYR